MVMASRRRYYWTEREADASGAAVVTVMSGVYLGMDEDEYLFLFPDEEQDSRSRQLQYFDEPDLADVFAYGIACDVLLRKLYDTATVIRHDGTPVNIDALRGHGGTTIASKDATGVPAGGPGSGVDVQG